MCSLALDLAAFPALADLDLHGNNLGGAIPLEFVRGRSNISYLDLSGNAFTGPIPDALPKSLQYLNLTDNAFMGPIPVSLVRMALQDLHLGFNNISGGVPEFLGSILQLKSLELGWNPTPLGGGSPLLLAGSSCCSALISRALGLWAHYQGSLAS